jgi:hypothetical protein
VFAIVRRKPADTESKLAQDGIKGVTVIEADSEWEGYTL